MKYFIFLFFLLFPQALSAQAQPGIPDSIMELVNEAPPEDRDSLLILCGNEYYIQQKDVAYDLAFKCYLESLNYAQKYKHDYYIAASYFYLGSVYDALQNPEALKYYTLYFNSALNQKRLSGNISMAAYTLATLYSRQKMRDSTYRYIAVMQHYADTVNRAAADRFGNNMWQAVYLQMAYTMLTLGDDAKLKYYFEKLPDTARLKSGLLPYERYYAEVKSKYLLITGNSKDFTQPLVELLAQRKDSLEILQTIINLLEEAGQYKEAFQYFKYMMGYAKSRDYAVFKEMQYKLLNADREQKARINNLLSNEQEHMKRGNRLLLLIALSLAVGLLAAFFAYRKIGRQNRALNEQNRKISMQSENIQSLIREIHHRVKNNLQIISSLIDLQQVKEQSANTGWVREIQSKMRTIALAHQMIYEQENTSAVSLQAYFTEMMKEMLQTLLGAEDVSYSVHMGSLEMGLEKLIPFAIIINEALVNTVKHAIPRKPGCHISVTAVHAGDTVTITYADNGPGLPVGADPSRPRSIGLRLIKKLASQAGATMAINNVPGEKLEFIFTTAAASIA